MNERLYLRSLLYLFLSLVIVKESSGQQRQIDSLEKLLSGKLDDSTRGISMMRLAVNY